MSHRNSGECHCVLRYTKAAVNKLVKKVRQAWYTKDLLIWKNICLYPYSMNCMSFQKSRTNPNVHYGTSNIFTREWNVAGEVK